MTAVACAVPRALLDFAVEYNVYSSQFTQLLTYTIDRLDKSHPTREALLENLSEEKGNVHNDEEGQAMLAAAGIEFEWISGVSHKQLFADVKNALVRDAGLAALPVASPDGPGATFNKVMYRFCKEESVKSSIAVLGLATEALVSTMYTYITTAVKEHTNLTAREACFFPLHAQCDEGHSALLEQAVAVEATTVDARIMMGARAPACTDMNAAVHGPLECLPLSCAATATCRPAMTHAINC